MIHCQKTHHSISDQTEDYINKYVRWTKHVDEFFEIYIFIYNRLNEGSFYQVGAYLEDGSCKRIGFLAS